MALSITTTTAVRKLATRVVNVAVVVSAGASVAAVFIKGTRDITVTVGRAASRWRFGAARSNWNLNGKEDV
jgi:tetrahydromethanopterin S-methyltransferase subunit E